MKYFRSKKHIENINNARLLGLIKLKEIRIDVIEKYNTNPKKCACCEKTLTFENKNKKFCNSSCAASFNNKKRILSSDTKLKISEKLLGKKQSIEHVLKISGDKNGRWKTGKYVKNNELKFCAKCGCEFNPKILNNNKISRSKYCSDECRNKDSSDIMIDKSNSGLLKGWTTRNVISYPEKFFMTVLNNNGIKFEHNYPINKRDLNVNDSHYYFLDFYISDKKIDLEIDGNQHKFRKESDNIRDNLLINNGYVVYRINWKNINTEFGKQYIKNEIDKFLEFYSEI